MTNPKTLKSNFKAESKSGDVDPIKVIEAFDVLEQALANVRTKLKGKDVELALKAIVPPSKEFGGESIRPKELVIESVGIDGAEGLIHALTDLYLDDRQDAKYVKRYLGLARVPDSCLQPIVELSDAKMTLQSVLNEAYPIKGQGAAAKMARQRWMRKHLYAYFDHTIDQRMLKRTPLVLKHKPQALAAYWHLNPITHESIDRLQLKRLLDERPCPVGMTLDELALSNEKYLNIAMGEFNRGRIIVRRFISSNATPMVYYRESDEFVADARESARPYVLPIILPKSACSDDEYDGFCKQLDLEDIENLSAENYEPSRDMSVLDKQPLGILNLESMAPRRK